MVDLPAPEIIEASEYFYPEMQVNIQTSQKIVKFITQPTEQIPRRNPRFIRAASQLPKPLP